MMELLNMPNFLPSTFGRWLVLLGGLDLTRAALCFSQPSLTIDDAIMQSLGVAPEYAQTKAMRESTQWKRTEVFGQGFLPKITISGNHFFNRRYQYLNVALGGPIVPFPLIYPTSLAQIDVSVPIFDGLANVRNLRAADLNLEAANHDLDFAKFELSQRVRLAFWQTLAANLALSASEMNVRSFQDHLDQTNALKRAGTSTRYDVLRVEVQLNEAHSDLIEAQDAVVVTRRKLAQVMGLMEDDRPLVGTLPEPDAAVLKHVPGSHLSALAQRPDLQALELRAQAAERMREAQRFWWSPQLSFIANATWYNNLTPGLLDFGNYRLAYNYGIAAKWNIFDGGVAYAQERQAIEAKTTREKMTQKALLGLPYDTAYWRHRYLSLASRYHSKRLNLKRSTESVRLASAEHRAGTKTASEVLDAELDLYRARLGVVDAQSKAAESLIQLELALGRKI